MDNSFGEPSGSGRDREAQIDELLAQFERYVRERQGGRMGERSSSPHPIFVELGQINRRSDAAIDGLGWDAPENKVVVLAEQAVNGYIDTIRKYRDQITPEVLLSQNNEMGGSVDPVFAVLLRTMMGEEIMTPQVFRRIRGEWCHLDLPDDVDQMIRMQDDREFVSCFEARRFDVGMNTKMKALQNIGIRDLIAEGRSWREQRASSPAPVAMAAAPA